MVEFETGEKLIVETYKKGEYIGYVEEVSEKYLRFKDEDLVLTFTNNEPAFLIGMDNKAIKVKSVERVSSYD
jgi:hypothetical protein